MKKINEDLYSPFKAAHHLEKIQKLRNGELILPSQIQVDLCNHCNHDCVYCFYRGVNDNLVTEFDRKSILTLDQLKALATEMDEIGVPAIQLTGGGEPLMHPDFLEYVRFLNTTNLETALVTNAALMTDEIIDNLYNMSWIRISIDAATAITYSLTQNSARKEFEKVTANVKKMAERLPKTVIGVSFVINPLNYKEIYDAVKLYKTLGVHNVRLSIAYTNKQTEIFEPFMDEIVHQARDARKLSTEDFRVFDLGYTHFIHLDAKKKNYKVCGYSHLTTAIEANGSVRPCCTMKGLPHSNFGNIKENSFKDIWFGQTRREWLDKFDANRCQNCWMDEKNEFLQYLITDDPMHVNYI